MIVKNESHHLKNCLTALQPLMRAVKSELIIADTGSDDDTVQIAKKFTNNVLEISWNNDFAEARNHTVRAAKGEWYMFIDADEYLEDSVQLIDFFISGAYKKATNAFYYIREYSSPTDYTETALPRLCKLTPCTKFTGSIHESLPQGENAIVLNAYVRHHGYRDSNDSDFFEKKMQRNLPILLKKYEKNPSDLLTIRYLFYSYNGIGERIKAKVFLDKGLSIIDKNMQHDAFVCFYHMRVEYCASDQKPNAPHRVLAVIDEYFMLKPAPSVGAIKMHIEAAMSHFVLTNYKAAASSFEKARDLLVLYNKQKLDISELGTLTDACTSAYHLKMVNEYIIKCKQQVKTTLSIGMIVKNESHHLKNCLTALQPLMNGVKSELIIADTGSTDDTLKIAQQFTNNILEIPWNNDFAQARNHTLKAAKGEWFMFLDADEYMEDGTEIIKFFTQGHYKKYQGAAYKIHNYLADGISFGEFSAVRLCRISENVQFEGYVHEHLTIDGEIYALNSHFRHYGYDNASEPGIIEQKQQRNLPLLHRMYNENPNDVNTLRYLAKTYISLREFDKAKTYLDEGLSITKENPNSNLFPAFYLMLVEYYIKLGTNESQRMAISTVDEYFTLRPQLSVTAIDMYAEKGNCHLDLKEYGQAIQSYENAHNLIQLFLDSQLDISEISTVNVAYASKTGLLAIAELIFECHVVLKNFSSATIWQKIIFNYIKHMSLEKLTSKLHQVIYHAQMADDSKHDKALAIKHIKSAMRTDSRFIPMLSEKLK